MTSINIRLVLGAVVFGICIPLFAITGTAQGQANPNVIQQSHNDTSPALSTLASLPNVPVTTKVPTTKKAYSRSSVRFPIRWYKPLQLGAH
jgi:hypothetical protein